MEIRKTRDFLRSLDELPFSIQKTWIRQEQIFKRNWIDPRLHTKKLKELKGVYSIRITRRYRALFYLKNSDAIFFAVGHRKEIYE